MRIEEKDSLEVYDFLRYEQQRGMTSMLYKEEHGTTTVPGIFCFPEREDSEQFCMQYPDFTRGMHMAAMSLVIDTMTAAMYDGETLSPATVNIKTHPGEKAKTALPGEMHDKVLWPFHIPGAVLGAVHEAVNDGMTWAAYNTSYRVLDAEDIFFTDNPMEAVWYADFKTNEIDHYSFRQFDSVEDFVYKITRIKQPDLFIKQNTNSMNNENAEYLQKQVKFAGFGEDLNRAIVNELKNDPGEFKLNYSHTFGKDTMDAELNFKRSKESDLYFFNSYDVTMKRDGKPDMSNTFFINQGQSITLREAYNLMNGRSVEKEFTRKMNAQEKEQYKAEFKLDPSQRGLPENWDKAPTYKAWIKLDMQHRDEHGHLIQKQYHQNFGFDLEKSLAKLPLRKMDASQEHEMLLSLKKGNITPVQFTIDGADKKMHLAADPQFKAITVYDDTMQLAKKETYSQGTKKEKEGQAVTEQKTDGPAQDKAQVKETVAVQGEVIQQPAMATAGDLVPGPEAPWEGKKTEVAQQPAEEKKTEIGKGVQEEKGVAKKDLLGKGKERSNLLQQKPKKGEGQKMKLA